MCIVICLTAVVVDKFEKGGDHTFQKGPGLADTLDRANLPAYKDTPLAGVTAL